MPQIEQIAGTYASQAFWLVVTFAVLYFGIAQGMLGRVGATVARRAAVIGDDLTAAERARAQAGAAQADVERRLGEARAAAQAEAAAAKSQAAARAAERLKAAQGGIDARLAEGEARVDAARRAALADLDAVASDAARAIIARLTGVDAGPERARAAVERARG